jgi:pimeloyl-ACP methyl ester carboxylesterase
MSMLRTITFWIALLELLAQRRGWRGLSWLPARSAGPVLAGVALATAPPLRMRHTRPRHLLAAIPALALQATLASLRNRALDPQRRLAPGEHADRTVERIDIAMDAEHMPALHLVPRAAAGAAALVLHGSGCDKTYYAWRLADALVARGIAVLLVDLDGHGESPRVQQYPRMLENVTVGAAWLRQRYERVGLVGVSLGGCLGARAAADGLELDALALLEAPPYLFYTRQHMRREAAALSAPFLLDLFGESTAYHLGYTIYDLVRVQSGPRIRYAIGTVDLIAALDLPASLTRIRAPLLLIYGGRDAIVRPDQVAIVRAAAPPHAQCALIPEASHLSLILHPGALALLGEWMAVTMNVECSSDMRKRFPVGTRFRIHAKEVSKEDGTPVLYTHFSWPYEVLR